MGSLSIFQPRPFVFLCLVTALLTNTARAQTLATSVPLIMPSAVALDGQGNLYIAETANHVIRKVDSSGHITTVAGTGTQGFAGDAGAATSALLDSPQGLAIDSTNLYIADTHNHRIRRVVLATGVITTVAGTFGAGSSGDNGPSSSASLDAPTALALDDKGNLFLADGNVHRIRRIDGVTGIISTVAGSGVQGFAGDGGAASSALIDSPRGLAVDAAGNIYFADSHNHRIRHIDAATGIITTVAGNGMFGFAGETSAAATAKLALPQGLSIDAKGDIYFADSANHRIRRIDATTGNISTVGGEGTQGFAGDGGAATAASLDSPRAVVTASPGSVTIADTGNDRIRQIASDTTLMTIAGLGAVAPGSLALSGPAVVSYGSGQITATLTSSSGATGTITFLDSYAGSSNTAATVPLASNTANLDTSQFAVGDHAITATYVGDSSHGAAQSAVATLTVNPLPVTVAITPSSISYGEPIPTITGSFSGILSRDQSLVSAIFSTTAAALAPVGSYSVNTSLIGSAAKNYTLANSPTLAIVPASTGTTLSATTASFTPATTVSAGDPITFTAHVRSQTSGAPTGSVTVLDGASMLAAGRVNSAGDMVFTSTALGAGAHTITAFYFGDGNFKPSSSPGTPLAVVATPISADFTLTPIGTTTQSIVSGTTASFTFGAAIQNGLSSSVSLSASGLPNLATASFNPAYIPPGSGSTTFTLTIATPKTARLERPTNHPNSAVGLAFAFIPLGFLAIVRKPRGEGGSFPLCVLILVAPMFCIGCGDRIYTGDRTADSPKTYTIVVTGTATSPTGSSVQHTANVTLVVLPPG